MLAREGGGRQVLRRRTGPDGVGGVLAERREGSDDRRLQVVGDRERLDRPAGLPADRADLLQVVGPEARQPIERAVDSRCVGHDTPERAGRDAEPGRHADAFYPRELAEARALAAGECDLCPVDRAEIHDVEAHPPGSVRNDGGSDEHWPATTW